MTALIYKAILRLCLTREIWSVVNVVAIGIVIVSIFYLPKVNTSKALGGKR